VEPSMETSQKQQSKTSTFMAKLVSCYTISDVTTLGNFDPTFSVRSSGVCFRYWR